MLEPELDQTITRTKLNFIATTTNMTYLFMSPDFSPWVKTQWPWQLSIVQSRWKTQRAIFFQLYWSRLTSWTFLKSCVTKMKSTIFRSDTLLCLSVRPFVTRPLKRNDIVPDSRPVWAKVSQGFWVASQSGNPWLVTQLHPIAQRSHSSGFFKSFHFFLAASQRVRQTEDGDWSDGDGGD